MLKQSNSIILSLILLSIQATIHSNSALQKISQKSILVIKTVFSTCKNISFHQNNSFHQKNLMHKITSKLLQINAEEQIKELQEALVSNDIHLTHVILDRCASKYTNKYDDTLNKIKKLSHEYACIESAKRL